MNLLFEQSYRSVSIVPSCFLAENRLSINLILIVFMTLQTLPILPWARLVNSRLRNSQYCININCSKVVRTSGEVHFDVSCSFFISNRFTKLLKLTWNMTHVQTRSNVWTVSRRQKTFLIGHLIRRGKDLQRKFSKSQLVQVSYIYGAGIG